MRCFEAGLAHPSCSVGKKRGFRGALFTPVRTVLIFQRYVSHHQWDLGLGVPDNLGKHPPKPQDCTPIPLPRGAKTWLREYADRTVTHQRFDAGPTSEGGL